MTTDSLSLLGFGVDAAIDSVASVALVWRFRAEATAAHRAEQVERLAETVIGAVLLVFAAYLGVSAARALLTSDYPTTTLVGAALLVASVVALPALARAKYRVARSLGSGALRADSLLTGFAALLALIALIGLLLSEALGWHWADAVGALLVVAILVREGIGSLMASRRPAR